MAKKRSTKKRLKALEQRLLTFEREQHALGRQLKELTRRIEEAPDNKRFFRMRSPMGAPPWRRAFGPVVSLEVPLETDDPAAPLWATVAARLPEEITTVGDDGMVARYRYSAVGSTPQAPRYRRIQEFDEPFPA
jgi:hypothetical protein